LDAAGNIYTAGSFGGTIDFDPGQGTNPLTSVTNYDGYILKLDANGNFVWVKQMASSNALTPKGLAVDASGNVFTSGYLAGTVDMDPGAGTANVTSAGGNDAYLLKLDLNGNYVWSKTIGSAGGEVGRMLAVDPAGNIYLSGEFNQSVDLDPGPGVYPVTTAGENDVFLVKFDNPGNFVWGTTIGNSSNNYTEGLTVKGIDDIYLAGAFSGSLNIYPPPGALYLNGMYDRFNSFVVHYATAAGGSLPLTLLNFSAVSNESHVQLQWQTTNEQNIAQFAIERSANGQTFETIGTANPANNAGLKNDYTFTDYQPLSGTSFYRLKITDHDGPTTYSRIIPVRKQVNGQALEVFPNPAKDVMNVHLDVNEPTVLKILDASGRIWKQQPVNFTGNITFQLDLQSLPSGNYYLQVKGKTTEQVKAFLKK